MPNCHCGKRAIYNTPDSITGILCNEHKEPHMINVKNPKCTFVGCITIANFNYSTEKKGIFCSSHKDSNMINVMQISCEIDTCTIRAIYNISGITKPRFCFKHKLSEMVNVISKLCEFNGCNIRPNYNIRGKSKPRFCSKHKEDNMINVVSKTCEISDCDSIPSYNSIGYKKGRFCVKHKLNGMIDVSHAFCKKDGCPKLATFAKSLKNKPCFCSEHKDIDMINVVNSSCIYASCTTRTKYGILGKPPTHCGTHKQKGMIESPTKKCSLCKQLGTYELDKIRFCEDHKPDNTKNLGVYPCTSCGLDDILTDGKCSTCDPSVQFVIQHAKENRIKDVLAAAKISFIHDKMLETTSCGRERPDFQIDCGTHMVYIEVDEHQHQSYACECEQTRMINIVHVRGMPTRFIRYNPDTYKPIKGRQVTAVQREKKLIEYIQYAIKNPPNESFADVIYLFYDKYDTTSQIWNTLINI
jgi:hypothetical protein